MQFSHKKSHCQKKTSEVCLDIVREKQVSIEIISRTIIHMSSAKKVKCSQRLQISFTDNDEMLHNVSVRYLCTLFSCSSQYYTNIATHDVKYTMNIL